MSQFIHIGAFTRHPSKSPVFLKSIRHREPSISQIWCTRRLSKNRAPYNITFSVFPFYLVRKSSTKLTTNLPSVIHSLFPVLGISWSEGHFHIVSHFCPSSPDMLESLVLQRSFEPVFSEGMFLSSLCLLFGLKKGAWRSASNIHSRIWSITLLPTSGICESIFLKVMVQILAAYRRILLTFQTVEV